MAVLDKNADELAVLVAKGAHRRSLGRRLVLSPPDPHDTLGSSRLSRGSSDRGCSRDPAHRGHHAPRPLHESDRATHGGNRAGRRSHTRDPSLPPCGNDLPPHGGRVHRRGRGRSSDARRDREPVREWHRDSQNRRLRGGSKKGEEGMFSYAESDAPRVPLFKVPQPSGSRSAVEIHRTEAQRVGDD